jgi:hypothetical protein
VTRGRSRSCRVRPCGAAAADRLAADGELLQMRVFPFHRGLDDRVDLSGATLCANIRSFSSIAHRPNQGGSISLNEPAARRPSA